MPTDAVHSMVAHALDGVATDGLPSA